jgi:hypothetical protein
MQFMLLTENEIPTEEAEREFAVMVNEIVTTK